jgi:HAD superfamily hydrolase (TIGR01493 family)
VAIRGVLIDFSDTLFRLEPGAAWVHGLISHDGVPLDAEAKAALVTSLSSPTTMTGELTGELRTDWERRDLDPEAHSRAYKAKMRASGHDVGPGVVDALYGRILAPTSWQPYPDTAEALRLIKDAGLPVAVVSNIAWDVRDVFDRHGMTDLVDEFVLSYVEGVVKPDPKIFLSACDRLGVEPEQALMIGDNAAVDGAAVTVGCRFERVEPQPTAQRRNALISAVRTSGIAA